MRNCHAHWFWYAVIGAIGALAFAVKWCSRASVAEDNAASARGDAASTRLGRRLRAVVGTRYLIPVLVFKAANWLQGPYFFAVYSLHLSDIDVNRVFIAGYVSSMILGTVASSISDVVGRKRGCVMCGALYLVSCLSVLSPSIAVLVGGRVAGGAASALLHASFEAWFVSDVERVAHCLRSDVETAADAKAAMVAIVGDVQSWETFANGLVSVAAGMIASEVSAARNSPTAAFELAALVNCGGIILITAMWTENYAEGRGSKSANAQDDAQGKRVSASDASAGNAQGGGEGVPISNAGTLLRNLWRYPRSSLAKVGAVQALFGSSMYVFVLYWSPQLKHVVEVGVGGEGEGGDRDATALPLGLVFSAFMVSIMLGSSVFAYGTKRLRTPPAAAASGALAAGGAALFGSALASYATSVFGNGRAASWPTALGGARVAGLQWALVAALFCTFEVACGVIFPAMASLRAEFVPPSVRATASSIFRMPLNMIVVCVLLSSEPLVGGAFRALVSSTGGGAIATSGVAVWPLPSPQQCALAACGAWLASAAACAYSLVPPRATCEASAATLKKKTKDR